MSDFSIESKNSQNVEGDSIEYFSSEEFEENESDEKDFEIESSSLFRFNNHRSSIINLKENQNFIKNFNLNVSSNSYNELDFTIENLRLLTDTSKRVRFADGTSPPQQTGLAVTIYSHEYVHSSSCMIYKLQVLYLIRLLYYR